MAEIIGLIASGVGITSLAIQIGDNILKLKSFWDVIKDAPEEIRYLIEEMEVLGLIVSDIEATISSNQQVSVPILDSATAARCLELCKMGVDALEAAVRDLAAELEKGKKRGGFKRALRQDTTDKLRERLRNAQTLLVLSQQTYYHALQTYQHNMQRQWAEQHQRQMRQLNDNLSQKSVTLFESDKHTKYDSHSDLIDSMSITGVNLHSLKSLKRQKIFTAKLQTPEWLPITQRALELCGYTHNSAWTISLRAWVEIEEDSEALMYARFGDLPKLQKLLQEGKASLYSRTENRNTLLDEAAWGHQVKTCQFLLDSGLDPNSSYHGSSFISFCSSNYSTAIGQENHGATDEEISYMAQKLLVMSDGDDVFNRLDQFSIGKLPVFRAIMHLSGQGNPRTLEERMALVFKIDRATPSKQYVDLVSNFLPKEIDISVAAYRTFRGETFLHAIARNLAENVVLQQSSRWAERADPPSIRVSGYELELPTLQAWVSSLLTAGSDPFALFHHMSTTPMVAMFSDIWFKTGEVKYAIKCCSEALYLWLQLLHGAGLNLEEYGEMSRRVHNQEAATKSINFAALDQNTKEWVPYRFRFLAFEYGPKPEDWIFYGTDEPENFAAEFWDMLEHPERAIPGSWNEFE